MTIQNNQRATKNHVSHAKMKHIELCHHYIKIAWRRTISLFLKVCSFNNTMNEAIKFVPMNCFATIAYHQPILYAACPFVGDGGSVHHFSQMNILPIVKKSQIGYDIQVYGKETKRLPKLSFKIQRPTIYPSLKQAKDMTLHTSKVPKNNQQRIENCQIILIFHLKNQNRSPKLSKSYSQ